MRAARWCLAIVLPLLATAGCERAGSATYRPPFVPVEFAVDTTGEVGISAGREVVTPLGTFGLKAQVKKDLSEDDTMVVIKHEVGGDTRKDVFVLDQQGGSACLNGTAVLTAGPANTIDLFVLAGSTVRIVDAATAPDACRETGRGPDTVVTGVDAWVAQLASLRDTSGQEVVSAPGRSSRRDSAGRSRWCAPATTRRCGRAGGCSTTRAGSPTGTRPSTSAPATGVRGTPSASAAGSAATRPTGS